MFTKMVDKIVDWIDNLHGMGLAVFVIVCLGVLIPVLILAFIVVSTAMKWGTIPIGIGLLIVIGIWVLICIIIAILTTFS